jgi:2-oxoglutarate ferredoxin oxidoreductase subunit delta
VSKKSVEIVINDNLCKGCEICINFCPKGVFSASDRLSARGYFIPEVTKPEDCTGCLLCEHMCPDLAITVLPQKKSARKRHREVKAKENGG